MEDKNEHSTNQEIANELLQMFQEDQDAIKARNGHMDAAQNRKHLDKLKKIIDTVGWPTRSLVGTRASGAAWLIVQHADTNVEFQEEVLRLMRSQKEGEVLREHIAYLEDRVRVNTDQPQLYGTQFYVNEQGVYGPRPIADGDNLDERRKMMGLLTMEEQTNEYNRMYQELTRKRKTE